MKLMNVEISYLKTQHDGTVAQCTTQYSGNAFVLSGIWQVIPVA